MGMELTAKFSNGWFCQNLDYVKTKIKNLPHYYLQKNDNEFWLKDKSNKSNWEFDVRLFTNNETLFVEVSAFSKAFTEDVRQLINEMNQITKVEFVDDDNEVYNWH